MKTYIFQVELHQEEGGRWSAWIEVLPGCAAWGYTREEALAAIEDAAEAYVEDMLEVGEQLPRRGERCGSSGGHHYPMIPPYVLQQLRNTLVRELISALERDSFTCRRLRGYSRVYRHLDGRRVVVHYHHSGVPSHRNPTQCAQGSPLD